MGVMIRAWHPRDSRAEGLLAIVLMDQALRHRAQNADVHVDTPAIPAHR